MRSVKVTAEDAPAQVLAASAGNLPPSLPQYMGDNCGCGGVMVLQPKYPSQPDPNKKEFKCGMCGKLAYL